jgi:hypothetical protein
MAGSAASRARRRPVYRGRERAHMAVVVPGSAGREDLPQCDWRRACGCAGPWQRRAREYAVGRLEVCLRVR